MSSTGGEDIGEDPSVRSAVPVPRISLPRVPPFTIRRDRLHERVAEVGLTEGVLLVSAPAGFGKTTFLSHWAGGLRSAGLPVAWLTCDSRDDARALWSGLAAAFSVAFERATPSAATARAKRRWTELAAPPDGPDSSFLATVVNLIDDSPQPAVLVLDDAHELLDPGALHIVDDLIALRPTGLRIALGARHDPPVALHRARLEGQLAELRADDLACSLEEAEHLLRAHGLRLDQEAVSRLHARTEGWPAGLRLAALVLEREADPTDAVARFAADHRVVADYLVTSVLSSLPVQERRLLGRTSIVDEVTAELAEALTGERSCGELLDGIARRNAFVTRLGRSGRWYRYHSLLREYLAAELRWTDAVEHRRLHGEASRWFLEHDEAVPALHHAVESRDPAQVVRTLDAVGPQLLLEGSGALRRTLERLSGPAAESRTARALHALVLLEDGRLADGDEVLRRLGSPRLGGAERSDALHVAASLLSRRMHAESGSLDPDDALAQLRLDLDADVRALVLVNVAGLLNYAGENEQAVGCATQALGAARRLGYPYLELQCLNILAGSASGFSDIPAMIRWGDATLELADRRGWSRSPRLAYAAVVRGWAAHLSLDPATARLHTSRALAGIAGAEGLDPEIECAAVCGEGLVRADDEHGRRRALQDVRAWWGRAEGTTISPALVSSSAVGEVHLCLALGEVRSALDTIARCERRSGVEGDVAVMLGLVELATGHDEKARQHVRPVIDGELVPATKPSVVSAWLVEATAAHRRGRTATAEKALRGALALSSETGCLRPYLDAGPVVKELLTDLLGRAGRDEEHLEHLLSSLAEVSGGSGGPPGSGVALTERERVVLRDLPSVLQFAEIAGHHQISTNTVKTHVRAIYRKLGVSSRRAAVAEARRLELL